MLKKIVLAVGAAAMMFGLASAPAVAQPVEQAAQPADVSAQCHAEWSGEQSGFGQIVHLRWVGCGAMEGVPVKVIAEGGRESDCKPLDRNGYTNFGLPFNFKTVDSVRC